MIEKTINEALVLMKVVRERVKDLKELRLKVSTVDDYFGSVSKKVIPQYDIKEVDRKITLLQNFLLIADSQIKSSNAKTLISLEINVDELLEPLK